MGGSAPIDVVIVVAVVVAVVIAVVVAVALYLAVRMRRWAQLLDVTHCKTLVGVTCSARAKRLLSCSV